MTWRLWVVALSATLAVALKDSGLSVALIDKTHSVAAAKGNLRISPAIEAHFWGIGVWDKILPRSLLSDKFASQMPIIRCGGIPTRRFRHGDTGLCGRTSSVADAVTGFLTEVSECQLRVQLKWWNPVWANWGGWSKVGVNPYNPHTITGSRWSAIAYP